MNISSLLEQTVKSTQELLIISDEKITSVLVALAEALVEAHPTILIENKIDLQKMDPNDPRYDRLLLTKDRIIAISNDIRKVASLTSPCGETLESKTLSNGLELKKIRVPLGVVGVIYEARPNVTLDVFALCFKSRNGTILKGSRDAQASNTILAKIIKRVLEQQGLDSNLIQLLASDRETALELMHANRWIDVLIPRGSSQLINFVRENSTVPVIETGAGIVHTYFDESADLEKGASIITNAKTRRVSVCNALDCLIMNQTRLSDLPAITASLKEKNVILFADPLSFAALESFYPQDLLKKASETSFGTEHLSLTLSIKTVATITEALEHIHEFSSKHSEAIISENPDNIKLFTTLVDAAAVYVNASTAFTDGAQFDLGAEIGISTQKLHARGPMGLKELTSYKWVIKGNGQVRP
ncbi:MAG: glutamate-5-semialdehyde dehydrogenase [Lentisphaeria bacterium]|nr:glutamate-5-semialdehyde dehydrogenase [Lentisphaeria bacterium]